MTGGLTAKLAAVARGAPQATALVEADNRRLSYHALATRIERLQSVFLAQGIRPGDRVLFAIRPSGTAIATMLALSACGAVIVAAPIGTGDALFRAQMALLCPQWVVAESLLIAAMRSTLVRTVVRWRGGQLPPLNALSSVRWMASGSWLPGLRGAARLEQLERRDAPATAPPPDVNPTDPGFVVFTSGTTAAPKAVIHSHQSMARTIDLITARLALVPGDRLLAGELHLIVPALIAGATAHLSPGGAFRASDTVARLLRERITHLFVVTAHLEQLVEHLERIGQLFPDCVQCIMVGGAPVRRAFFERLRERLPAGAVAWCVYGMTEMLPVAVISLEEKLAFQGEGDIVGEPVNGVTVTVSSAHELSVTGAHLFSGYLGHEPVTRHATGDLARLDEGRIVLIGRAKDMIIRRTFNIYPELYEPTIEQLPGVRRCALIGLYDDTRADERVVLVVEPVHDLISPGERHAFCAQLLHALERGPFRIDEQALPDAILIAPLPPAGRSDKIDKTTLRAMVQSSSELWTP